MNKKRFNFLINFDQMKSFKNYFPKNNVEIVLKNPVKKIIPKIDLNDFHSFLFNYSIKKKELTKYN